jgi:phenylacetate-coenzyme A ligase PaaK-like adenylate-forming protein
MRQPARQAERVSLARRHSKFYAERYRDLPASQPITDVRRLPFVTKPELTERLDDWVTDPAPTRAGPEQFVADTSNIVRLHLDRYTVCTTSGTTGAPAILVQDPLTMTVVGALNVLRVTPAWLTGPNRMKIRLETTSPAANGVWETLKPCVSDFLARQRLAHVIVECAPELPVRDTHSGKFRHVWAEKNRAQ